MSKVLVIRKPDATIHQVPIENKAGLMAFSRRLPVAQQWSFEEVEEDKAAKLPFIDKDFVSAGEAVTKVKTLEGQAQAKDARIAELEAMLAAKSSGPVNVVTSANFQPLSEAKVLTPEESAALAAQSVENDTQATATGKQAHLLNATDTIVKINEAKDAEEVKQLLGNDERKTVQDAAEKKIASFE